MTQKRLLFPAFAASFIVPAVIFMVISTVHEGGLGPWWGIAFPIVVLVTLCHSCFLGLPCVLLLMGRGDLRFKSLALTGFCIGAVPAAFIALMRNPSLMLGEPSDSLIAVFQLGLLGMSGGIAFFLVWDRFLHGAMPAATTRS